MEGLNHLQGMIEPGLIHWLLVLLTLYPGFQMGSWHLTRPWLILLLSLWGVLALNYLPSDPPAWAGLSGLWAVFGAWCYLRGRYAGQSGLAALGGCSAFTLLTLWLSLSTGLVLITALISFSGLHCFLHEREERAIAYGKVPQVAVFARWAHAWGLYWALPTLVGFGLAALLGGPELAGRSWEIVGASGNDALLPWGYFSSFHQEFAELWPGRSGSPMPGLSMEGLMFSCLKSMGLLLIGLMPILGILGGGYHIPGRFVYRLLQRPDEELLLFWLSGMFLIIATGGHATSGSIVGNGFLAFLLAFWVCSLEATRRLRFLRLGKCTLRGE